MKRLIIVLVVGMLGMNLWTPEASFAQLDPGEGRLDQRQKRDVSIYRERVTVELKEFQGGMIF